MNIINHVIFYLFYELAFKKISKIIYKYNNLDNYIEILQLNY